MKSASNLINIYPKEQKSLEKTPGNYFQFQNLNQQQQHHRNNLQSLKTIESGSKGSNINEQVLKNKKHKNIAASKQSNSQSRNVEKFKNVYFPQSTSQNKFKDQVKQVNISHQLERNIIQQKYNANINLSLNNLNRKKIDNDVTLPNIGNFDDLLQQKMLMSRSSYPIQTPQKEELSIQTSEMRQSGQKSAEKLNQMINFQIKQKIYQNASTTKNLKSLMVTSTPIKQQIIKSLNQTTNPINHKNNESEMGRPSSPLLPIESLPRIEQSRVSQKQVGFIAAYGANTHQGLVRNYNEDRVSIILNMMKPPSKGQDIIWPQCSFFAIYDGHGGSQCAEFLRDNLHYYIIKDENFPQNPKLAILKGYEKLESDYLKHADSGKTIEKSGSCAVSVLIVDQICYVANVGDSRAVLSSDRGNKTTSITIDHKPNIPTEELRIIGNGGQIYRSQIPIQRNSKIEYVTGPYRVLPGRLAVSRTFGDAEAKLPKYNGIPEVVSAIPDVFQFQISEEHDFLLLGCDGIFDKLTSKDVVKVVWNTKPRVKNIHELTGKAIENVMCLSLQRKSFDNVTVVLILFQPLERNLNKK